MWHTEAPAVHGESLCLVGVSIRPTETEGRSVLARDSVRASRSAGSTLGAGLAFRVMTKKNRLFSHSLPLNRLISTDYCARNRWFLRGSKHGRTFVCTVATTETGKPHQEPQKPRDRRQSL
jgi:hypothetical protein